MRSISQLRARGPVVALLAVVLLAAGCTGSGRSSPPAELVWAIGEIDAKPDGPAQAVAALWNGTHPDRPKVRVEALPESADEQRQLMAIELNAGLRGFDILSLDVVWTGEFAESRWLVDLEDERREIERVSLPAPFQSAVWKGKLWAAPFTSGAGILYYRTDLVPTPPTTWEDLFRVGLDRARQAGIEPYVGQGAQYEGMVVNFLEYFWGAGGEVFDADRKEVRFEQDAAVRAIDFMRTALRDRFYAESLPHMTEQDALEMFREGKALFMRNWPHAYADVTGPGSKVEGRVGIAPLPTFEGGAPVSALGGQNLAVSRYAKDVDTAKDFVKFASTDARVQHLLGNRPHSRAPTMASVYEELDADPVMALLARVLPGAKARPPTPNWASISDEIQQQVFPAYTGDRKKSGDAVDAIRSFLERSLRER